jgi:CheY-like chemotaxis protein
MTQGQDAATILLYEPDPSFRRLISVGLQQHELHVVETSSPTALPSEQAASTELLIVDVDRGPTCDWSLLSTLLAHPMLAGLPVIVLAWENPRARIPSALLNKEQPVLCMTKPFDARTLHAEVDRQLASRQQQKAQMHARKEAALLAAYNKEHIPASIWPVITAAGLFIAFFGFLFQFILLLIGVSIVIFSLLLWMTTARRSTPHISLSIPASDF